LISIHLFPPFFQLKINKRKVVSIHPTHPSVHLFNLKGGDGVGEAKKKGGWGILSTRKIGKETHLIPSRQPTLPADTLVRGVGRGEGRGLSRKKKKDVSSPLWFLQINKSKK
jgi:hypothetical protein